MRFVIYYISCCVPKPNRDRHSWSQSVRLFGTCRDAGGSCIATYAGKSSQKKRPSSNNLGIHEKMLFGERSSLTPLSFFASPPPLAKDSPANTCKLGKPGGKVKRTKTLTNRKALQESKDPIKQQAGLNRGKQGLSKQRVTTFAWRPG